MRRFVRTVLVSLSAMLVLTACGGGDDEEPSTRVWNENDITHHMGLERDGVAWELQVDFGSHCNISIVLTSASQVNLYTSAGDTVATNLDKSAGVKSVNQNSRTCFDAASNALEDLE